MSDKNNKKKVKIQDKKLKQEKKIEQELIEYKMGWQRATADYKNLIKETEENKKEYLDWSKRQIIEEFIPIYDNFKKAFRMEFGELDKKTENWKIGIEYIMKQFWKVLENHNIEEIKTVGEKFDANFHEAISEEETEEETGIILREIEAGYTMNNKIIKVAKVIIAK